MGVGRLYESVEQNLSETNRAWLVRGNQTVPLVSILRCRVTGNECGTDTWCAGFECQCDNCQIYLRQFKGGQGGCLVKLPEGMSLKQFLEADGIIVNE